MSNVIPLYSSRTIGRRTLDLYPGADGVEVYIWRNECRDTGYSVHCANRAELMAELHKIEVQA